MRRRAIFAFGTTILATLGVLACAPAEVEDPAAIQAAEDIAWLKENKPVLDSKRQELQEIQDRLAGKVPEGEAAAEGGEEGVEPPTPEELAAQATELAAQATELGNEIIDLSNEIGQRVASFLNNSNITVGEEFTPDQRFAVDVKVAEDIAIGQEYIDKGGDYKKAIGIYEMARQLDPDSELLAAKIAEAEDLRWMSEERFAQVKKKMTQDEVRELIGIPMSNNIRDYRPDRPVLAWFYRKEDGGAAGVFYREKNKGKENWQVYELDYDAVKRQVEGEE